MFDKWLHINREHHTISTLTVNCELYLTDEGWTSLRPTHGAIIYIPLGIYQLDYVYVNEDGNVGFNYKKDEFEPEFRGIDLIKLSKDGHITFE